MRTKAGRSAALPGNPTNWRTAMGFFRNPTLARYTHAIMRIVIGLLFMQHGAQKLLGWFGGMDGKGMTAELMSQIGLAGVLELVGGVLIVLGLFTRIVALILSGALAGASRMASMPASRPPTP